MNLGWRGVNLPDLLLAADHERASDSSSIFGKLNGSEADISQKRNVTGARDEIVSTYSRITRNRGQ